MKYRRVEIVIPIFVIAAKKIGSCFFRYFPFLFFFVVLHFFFNLLIISFSTFSFL